jgi:hypothetical protein
MSKDPRKLLAIPKDRLQAINDVLLDPNSQVMNDFLAVVAKYGTPDEINKKHRASRKLDTLMKKVNAINPAYVKDLKWLIEQRDRGAFIPVADYRRQVLGPNADRMVFRDESAVTLEVSALQYFPWIRPMCEKAIADRTLVPGRFIAVRKMKESEADGDLPAIVAALDIIGASFVETQPASRRTGDNHRLFRWHRPAERARPDVAG